MKIRRFHEAVKANVPIVTCCATGSSLWEFLHVDDHVKASVFALNRWKLESGDLSFINIDSGTDLLICDIVQEVANKSRPQCEILWDSSQEEATPKKVY